MSKLLETIKRNQIQRNEAILLETFEQWAIGRGYSQKVVDLTIQATIEQGNITRVGLLANLSDKFIKYGKDLTL